MPPVGDGGLDSASDDDLIEIHAEPVNRPRNSGLILPQPTLSRQTSQSTTSSDTRRRTRRQPHPSAPPPPRQQDSNAVIDLTEEPDSPVLLRAQPPPQPPPQPQPNIRTGPGRNPRRTNSQRVTPPRLSRSESILLASQHSFIDLTGDDDVEEVVPEQPPRRSQRNNQRPRLPPNDQLIELEFINSQLAEHQHHHHHHNYIHSGGMAPSLGGFGRALTSLLNADFIRGGFRPPRAHMPYAPAPPRREPTPKPPMSPTPPTRDGFTRDTCAEPDAGVERVVVCPACNEELGYDPSGTAVQTAPGGQKKRRRAPGDHHFWALKKCGHVSTLTPAVCVYRRIED
jgi:hypothetical protein